MIAKQDNTVGEGKIQMELTKKKKKRALKVEKQVQKTDKKGSPAQVSSVLLSVSLDSGSSEMMCVLMCVLLTEHTCSSAVCCVNWVPLCDPPY